MTREQLRQQMCDIGHRIWLKGFCAGNEGNHSARIGENEILCTPTGVSKGFLTPDMITVVDLDGNQLDTANPHKRTSEVLLHLQIYKKRPDVKAVIHSHPPHATTFACAGIPIPEKVHPEAEFFLGKIRTVPYVTPGYTELGESVAAITGPDTNTVMLGNHGSVSFSTSLMDAYYKLEILDAYCRLLLNLQQLGQVSLLTDDQMMALMKAKQQWNILDARLETKQFGLDNAAFISTLKKP
jgi:L-fuculose-phosphate aldolase